MCRHTGNDNKPIQKNDTLKKTPILKYDPVTSCHKHLPTTGECTIAILMDAHKMMTNLILLTLMTEMMTDLILE